MVIAMIRTKHSTEIADFSAAAGDIKYVWEKSRLLFYTHSFATTFRQAKTFTTVSEIDSWIAASPSTVAQIGIVVRRFH